MKKIIVLFLITSFLFSCKKDKDSTTKSQLLTRGSWRTTSTWERSEPTEPWVTSTGSPACNGDDIIIFNPANTWIINGGTLFCTGQSQTLEQGFWTFTIMKVTCCTLEISPLLRRNRIGPFCSLMKTFLSLNFIILPGHTIRSRWRIKSFGVQTRVVESNSLIAAFRLLCRK